MPRTTPRFKLTLAVVIYLTTAGCVFAVETLMMETVWRIDADRLIRWILPLPTGAFIIAVVLSLLFHFEQSTATHCTEVTYLLSYDKLKQLTCVWLSVAELQSVTCHMRSHCVTCHPAQVNLTQVSLTQAKTGCYRYLIYSP